MSWAVRVILIIGSILTTAYVLRRIRKSKMRTEDSVYWLLFSVVLVIMGVFPGIAIAISDWIGVQSAANLVFLVVIFLLLIKVFSQDQKISKLNSQITQTIQSIAISREEDERK